VKIVFNELKQALSSHSIQKLSNILLHFHVSLNRKPAVLSGFFSNIKACIPENLLFMRFIGKTVEL